MWCPHQRVARLSCIPGCRVGARPCQHRSESRCALALQLTFPGGPVVLTSARVGAVPASGAQTQRAQLLLFAADAGAPATARFLQLCPGFEQPESGTRVVHLQVSAAA